MRKTTRIIYLMIGIIMPILIGSLHTFVHFTDLTTAVVYEHLNTTELIRGHPYWDAWGLMSFMMGFSFIIIGLLNIYIFRSMKKTDYPPLMALFIMALYLLGVIYAGHTFNALEQSYGALCGLGFAIIAIVLTIRGRSE